MKNTLYTEQKGNRFEVIQHPHSKGHLLFKVTTARGRVYACASAWDDDGEMIHPEPKPTTDTVQYHWRHCRWDFLPYDESTGSYVG